MAVLPYGEWRYWLERRRWFSWWCLPLYFFWKTAKTCVLKLFVNHLFVYIVYNISVLCNGAGGKAWIIQIYSWIYLISCSCWNAVVLHVGMQLFLGESNQRVSLVPRPRKGAWYLLFCMCMLACLLACYSRSQKLISIVSHGCTQSTNHMVISLRKGRPRFWCQVTHCVHMHGSCTTI